MAVVVDLRSPSIDLDRRTGEVITGWESTVQSIEEIFLTNFGERVMREWFGSMVPRLLGELLNNKNVLAFFTAVCSAIEQWEPRYRVTKIIPLSVSRQGEFHVEIQGEYRPRALFGDFTVEGSKRLGVLGDSNGLRLAA